MPSRPRVALALGSGGARGYAHAGVVEVLEDRGYDVVAVAGTSMGALVGGFVAAGRLPEFVEWARGLQRRDVLRLVDPKPSSGGVMLGDRLIAALAPLLGQHEIEQLPIPYTAVATDLLAAREVWFQSGPLLQAIRASIAIPGAITPALVEGRLLADGGLLNPLPLDPLAAVRADLTIAVSLQGARVEDPRDGVARAGPAFAARVQDARVSLSETLRGLGARGHLPSGRGGRWTDGGDGDDGDDGGTSPMEETKAEQVLSPPELITELKTSAAVALSLEAMQALIARFRLAAQSPDLLINVPLSTARTLDFHRAAEVIDVGRAVTTEALDRLEDQSHRHPDG